MSDYIKLIRTTTGDKQIDYTALANLPTVNNKVLTGNVSLTATDVGADINGAATEALNTAKEYTDTEVAKKADSTHSHNISDVTNLQSSLDGKVSTNRTINGKALTSDITLSASDVGADASGAAEDALASAKKYADGINSALDTKISNITSGTTKVANATHADTSDTSVSADIATSATKATQDGNGKVIADTYETKTDASSKLTEAKEYTDTVASGKSDSNHNHDSAYDTKGAAANALTSANTYTDGKVAALVNGAPETLNTLDELAAALDDNADILDVLNDSIGNKTDKSSFDSHTGNTTVHITANERTTWNETLENAKTYTDTVANGKADKTHSHTIADVTDLQTALDGKAASSHGTHVTYSTAAPVMDGTASVGTATTVARSDHKHPTDTSRASKTEFDSHASDTTKHITSTERNNWNAAKTHADSAHAPSNAEKNQNAFSNIAVGSTTIAADSVTDTLTLAGSNVTITPDATNDKVTIGITKANVTAALGYTPQESGSYAPDTHTHDDRYYTETEIDEKLEGKASSAHTHSDATTSSTGFMTAAMVTKLNGIAEGANHTTVDASLSSTSTNPVQNKTVNSAITGVIETVSLNTQTISGHTQSISALQTEVNSWEEITTEEIQGLFA